MLDDEKKNEKINNKNSYKYVCNSIVVLHNFLMFINNVNVYTENKICDSKLFTLCLVITASTLMTIVDTYVFKKLIQCINRLLTNYKANKANKKPVEPLSLSFKFCRGFVWLTVLVTIFESINVVYTRVMQTPDLFGDDL